MSSGHCKLCLDFFNPGVTRVGFGDGSGQEFVHRACYTAYQKGRLSLKEEICGLKALLRRAHEQLGFCDAQRAHCHLMRAIEKVIGT